MIPENLRLRQSVAGGMALDGGLIRPPELSTSQPMEVEAMLAAIGSGKKNFRNWLTKQTYPSMFHTIHQALRL